VAISGSAGVVDGDDGRIRYGERYLSRQIAALGGGTTEIARNIIGARVLGFPRARRRSWRAVQSGQAQQVLSEAHHDMLSANAICPSKAHSVARARYLSTKLR
jgi:hypothetical protein